MSNNGKLEWTKYSCNDESDGAVLCAKRNIWETVQGCYAQPPEERDGGFYEEISAANVKKDPVMFCRDKCKQSSKYFDIMGNDTGTLCHCHDTKVPLGGFLPENECKKSVCISSNDTTADTNCHPDDGFRRTRLFKTWETSCPALGVDLEDKFVYIWQYHGSWHWGSRATLRCLPGYELPQNPGQGTFDHEHRTQEVFCEYDEENGGKWSRIVECEPVKCKQPPPDLPAHSALTVVKSLDPLTNRQAETILMYTCLKQNWAFDYPYDESLPSFAFTNNVGNITITCNYSGYWEYSDGIEGSTCVNKQPDGTCEKIVIPDCVDRNVYCKELDTPANATREVLYQPNSDNERVFETKIKLECNQYEHYFDYNVPPDLVSFYYSTNIKTTILTCNEYSYWTVENGLNGETCADKKQDDDELWCDDVLIPSCVDRAIRCTHPPNPERSDIIFHNKPDEQGREYKTEITYQCPGRLHYFDYPVGDDFISFYYTDNINEISVECNQDSQWEVTGGLINQTCSDPILRNSSSNETTFFECKELTIPHCEDRALYCTFPPTEILGGDVTFKASPSPSYQKTDNCRWTKWFNSGKGGRGDKEIISELVGIYSWQVCPEPNDIKVRNAATKEVHEKTGSSFIFATYDTTEGFECNDGDQLGEKCPDFEVQFCCPFAPESGTEVAYECNIKDWYLDYLDAPFITTMTATCTQNSTWVTEIESATFCSDETLECAQPRMPDCQDRTILCLDELPIPKGLLQVNVSSNETLHGFSIGAAYEYSCEEDGFVVDMPNYPEAIVVNCSNPQGYPNEWYYEIWKDGIWTHRVIFAYILHNTPFMPIQN